MEKKKKRPLIAHVVSYYPPHIGGMETNTHEVSLNLAQKNWPVQVITSNVGAADAPAEEKKGNYFVKRLKSIEFAHTPVMWGLLRKLFSLPKKSVIHLHVAQIITPEAVWLVNRIRRIPYIAHFHLDVGPSSPLGFLFLIYKKLFLGIILRDAYQVLVYSQEQADLIIRKYFIDPQKITIIPNGVADHFFKFKPRTLPKDTLKLLFVGRLSVQKRVDRLLDAIAITKAPVELTIVGDGDKRASLEKQVKRLGLNNVTFVGAKTGDQLVKFYQGADAFVLPSDREGTPQVLLQAMANGLPVIGANVLGIAEFMGDSGILAEPSPKGFAQALDDLWQKKGRLRDLSRLGLAKAKKYSWNNLVKKIVPLYESATKETDEKHEEPVRPGFNRIWLVAFILLWGSLFATFRFNNLNSLLLNVIGFSFLLFAPGMLTYLILRFPKDLPLFGKLALVIVFSLLELIIVALLSNTVLPLFGVARPLDPIPLAVAVTLLMLGLLLISWRRLATWHLDFKHIRVSHFRSIDWLASLFPLVFIVMSVMGAVSLNNGGTNIVTIVMLATIAAYFIWLISKSNKISSDAITAALYLIALSLLLMTSMRGWYTTGHDIQREFYVFMLAKNHGIWKINYYRDAYNACLSLTLLPNVFANLLRFPDPYVFKVFFQMIFAVTSSLVFLVMRRYLEPALAVIASIWFMAFPTYFSDMPMLNRQEIAFLFLALMLWVVFESKFKVLTRQSLFILFGISIAMLHYSTIYSIIVILAFSVALRWSLPILKIIGRHKEIFNQSAIDGLSEKNRTNFNAQPLLTLPVLILFISASFLWANIITGTGSGFSKVVAQSIKNMVNLTEKNNRSSDVLYNIFSWEKVDKQDSLDAYVANMVRPLRERSKDNTYFDPVIVNRYPIKIAEENNIPLSKTGQSLMRLGINVKTFNFIFRQATAKVMQLLIILGFIYLVFRKRYVINNSLNTEFAILAAGSLLFVLLFLILPVISTQYGLLRAFQQTLMILTFFLVIGSLLIAVRVPEKMKIAFATFLAVTFFLSTTGFLTQILGGYPPQLHLNNAGAYYDNHLLHRGEILGSKWLDDYSLKAKNKDTETAQFDMYTLDKINSLDNLKVLGYIFPELIKKDSYVFIGPQTLKKQSSFSYQGNIVTYSYPIEFLDNEKDLIYSNGNVRVYK